MRGLAFSAVLAFASATVVCGQGKGGGILRPTISKPYQLWGSENIHETLNIWEEQYPDLIRVTTSQERYGLLRAGTDDDCVFEGNTTGCSNYFFTIQDFVAHPDGSESSQVLPEIFWNGAIHGDEKIGATVVMETASLMLEAATCESRPRQVPTESWIQEVTKARECRNHLREIGIDNERRKWLARLVSTRRIVVAPVSNALGFDRDEQNEGTKDPDQDFPYARQNISESSCMETITARTINEIFQEHLFQISLSFHSGPDDTIGFSWGSEHWGEYWYSPDLKAEQSLAEAREIALGEPSADIEIGELNKLASTPTRVGITEDWAYAASWDHERLGSCAPTTFGGYPTDKIVYNNSTNRAIALTLSTKMDEQGEARLGSSANLFQENEHDFLVTRNIRMALLAAELVEPYVSIVNIGTTLLDDDIVPLTERGGRHCQSTKAVFVPSGMDDRLLVEWTVGGGFHFSDVEMWYGKWDEFTEEELGCLVQTDIDVRLDPRFHKGYLVEEENLTPGNGTGAFSSMGPQPLPEHSRTGAGKRMGPVFRASVDLSDYKEGDQLVVIAGARVDQDWAVPPSEYAYGPRVGPQSHLINGRTNPDWNHKLENGKTVRGRSDWYSIPVTIVLADYDARIGTMQLNDRFRRDVDTGPIVPKEQKSGPNQEKPSTAKRFGQATAAIIVAVVVAFIGFLIYRKFFGRKTKKVNRFARRQPYGKDRDEENLAVQYSWEDDRDDQVLFEDMQQAPKGAWEEMDSEPIFDFDYAQDAEFTPSQTQGTARPFHEKDSPLDLDFQESMILQIDSYGDDTEPCERDRRISDEEVFDFEAESSRQGEENKSTNVFGSDYDVDNVLIFSDDKRNTFDLDNSGFMT
jgi:hypothetical protein